MLSSTSSSPWTSRLQNFWRKVSQTSRESWHLTRACWKPSPSSTSTVSAPRDRFKSVLLEHAQMHNQVAVRILLLEKEWGLFKYHGASGYLQRKWASGSTLPNNEPDHEQKNDKKEDDTAQIAFMITSRMKQQLQEALGYSETLIKSMTPLQASLVLKYQILPYEYNGKLPQLEEDYHIQQEQKRQAEQEKRTRHSQLEQEGNQSAAVNESFSTSTESSNSPQVPLETSSPSTASMLFNDNLPTGRTRIKWYEVIQTQPNGEETKLGLYRTPEEAQEGVDALKYIAEKRQEMNRTQLSIRPSLR